MKSCNRDAGPKKNHKSSLYVDSVQINKRLRYCMKSKYHGLFATDFRQYSEIQWKIPFAFCRGRQC